MSRFSGKQYPGAMKDYRVVKREEATARQAKSARQKSTDAGDALIALGSFIAAPFVIASEALMEFGEAIIDLLTGGRQPTQADFALIPSGISGGKGGWLPQGVHRVRNDTGRNEYILTPEQWADIEPDEESSDDQ